MSIEEGRLFCCECGRQYEHESSDDCELLTRAQNDGWDFGHDGAMDGDICPACQQAEGAAI